MRARATVVGAVGSAAILAIAWQVGSSIDASNGGPSGGGARATAKPAASAASSGSFTGASENTRYGSVQVKIVVAGGKITDVVPVHLTDRGGRSVQLSNRAAPILRAEVLKSQSAKVASVGGATYTTDAYLLSLQSALDQAGL
ncbi:FMN-binding protein [soil metagenome]